MNALGTYSEVGTLRTVLVHRPGLALERLTPANREQFLFDDLVWVERAQAEHDGLVEALRANDVEVLYLQELLTETLAGSPLARAEAIASSVSSFSVGLSLVSDLRAYLSELAPERLADALIGGLLASELEGIDLEELARHSLGAVLADSDSFIFPPLPNTIFTRDSSAWVGKGVVLPPLFWSARRLEVVNLSIIYRYHPLFADAEFEFWYPQTGDAGSFAVEDFSQGVSLEGGDVIPLSERTVLVGLGARSTDRMIEHLARSLFRAGEVDRVIVCRMEQERAYMHLDTVFGVLDHDAVTVYPPVVEGMRVYSVRPGAREDSFEITEERGLIPALEDAMGVSELRVIETGGDSFRAAREQWDDANNVVAVKPGVVIGYAKNQATNDRMRQAGIEVIEIEGSELGKGRGGCHCMTCPIARDPLD